jgi:UPF0755 protein
MIKKLLIAATLAAFLLTSAFGLWVVQSEKFLDNTIVTLELEIPKNANFNYLYDRVFKNLETPIGFRLYLIKVMKVDRNLKYGYYRADEHSIRTLLNAVMSGRQSTLKVTIPEGYNIYDISNKLSERIIEDPKEFLRTAKDKEYIKTLTGGEYASIEGFLYPNTYRFPPKSSPKTVINAMYRLYLDQRPADFDEKAKKLGKTPYEALILASIIQKETYDAEEAPIISSVFHNRLKYRMRLQADPTIIYGLYPEFDGNITKKNLRDSSNPYNTYKINGLPPTPICNPSKVALEAAVNPADTKYLYFVATKDRKHIFTTNYRAHRREVYRHQKR